MVYEQKYLKDYEVPPLLAVGLEGQIFSKIKNKEHNISGLFGMTILSLLMIPMYYIHVPRTFSTNPGTGFERKSIFITPNLVSKCLLWDLHQLSIHPHVFSSPFYIFSLRSGLCKSYKGLFRQNLVDQKWKWWYQSPLERGAIAKDFIFAHYFLVIASRSRED